MMARLVGWLGSLHIAVPLMLVIATVLGWGTFYEARFGTQAVQRLIYQSWWFHGLLLFLAVNLAVAAFQRYPWQRRHTPFVLAHIGIILVLLGGVIGGRWGVEGQLIIPEGHSEHALQLPTHLLVVRQQNPGIDHAIPTAFEASAWQHEPQAQFTVPLEGRVVELTVDRYYPDAVLEEQVRGGAQEENPAIQVNVRHGEAHDTAWLFARDPDRFGALWDRMHLVFLAPAQESDWLALMPSAAATVASRGIVPRSGAVAEGNVARSAGPFGPAPERGIVTVDIPHMTIHQELPVPQTMGEAIAIEGTPYQLLFKDYFPDFAIGEQGPLTRSDQPNNPAVSFVLSGPEGADPHLLFSRHPDFQALHGRTQRIQATLHYTHPVVSLVPPNAIAVIARPQGGLAALMTGPTGEQERIDPLELTQRYLHPWLGHEVELTAYESHATIHTQFSNRSNEVRAPALHVIGREGEERAEAWVVRGEHVELPLGADPLRVSYGFAQASLPFSVKLLDFRRTTYPGTQIASSFESDVELSDPERGLILMRTIRMNQPLRYRGFHLYQASFISGPIETTVLAVRSDPGTPVVYAGCLIIMVGLITMFLQKKEQATSHHEGRQRHHGSR